jgi:hypothetical protein
MHLCNFTLLRILLKSRSTKTIVVPPGTFYRPKTKDVALIVFLHRPNWQSCSSPAKFCRLLSSRCFPRLRRSPAAQKIQNSYLIESYGLRDSLKIPVQRH